MSKTLGLSPMCTALSSSEPPDTEDCSKVSHSPCTSSLSEPGALLRSAFRLAATKTAKTPRDGVGCTATLITPLRPSPYSACLKWQRFPNGQVPSLDQFVQSFLLFLLRVEVTDSASEASDAALEATEGLPLLFPFAFLSARLFCNSKVASRFCSLVNVNSSFLWLCWQCSPFVHPFNNT